MFKELLNNLYSKMAHCTPCYEYSYEYTRFHLFFFTENSVEFICNKCNIAVESIEKDPAKSYINYIYIINEKEYMDRMLILNDGFRENEKITIKRGGVLYGLYIDLNTGKYVLEIKL